MEVFLTRKRSRTPASQAEDAVEEESTEVKLAILASLHPDLPEDVLFDALLASSGDVQAATRDLGDDSATPSTPGRKRPRFATGYQSSLSTSLTSRTTTKIPSIPRSLTKKGRTLHLFAPADVERHTPCSIIHNFLPASLADALLSELVVESPTYIRSKFQLFDRTVESPHTFAFYVADPASQTKYFYNGAAVCDVRSLLPHMRAAAPLVDAAVNSEVSRRVRTRYPGGRRLRFQSGDAFEGNAAFVNVYDGGAQGVGWHADELTYLGPRAVIGSVSLGVAREFRVRRIVPRRPRGEGDDDEAWDEAGADAQGQIAIHLPHNSLLVMHAEMQEEWKHSIAPAASIDPHPISGNARVNITYRHYKDSMHPRHTPRCRCGVPVTLRCSMKSEVNRGRYFWQCHVGSQPDKKGCGFFEWAVFDDQGRPPWGLKAKDAGV